MASIRLARLAGLFFFAHVLIGAAIASQDSLPDPVLLSPSSFNAPSASFVIPESPTYPEPPAEPEQLHRRALTMHAQKLVERFRLPLEIAGFSANSRDPDEEFTLYEGRQPGRGAILFNPRFWGNRGYDDNNSYLAYVLFRAAADYFYRRHIDADHCSWIAQNRAEPLAAMTLLRAAAGSVVIPLTLGTRDDMDPRSRDFRESLDPEGNPARILQLLTHYGLKAIEQRAADLWALAQYQSLYGRAIPYVVDHQVAERERMLAWDFSRAVLAMTLAERISFRQALRALGQAPSERPESWGSPLASAGSDGTEATDPLLTDPDLASVR